MMSLKAELVWEYRSSAGLSLRWLRYWALPSMNRSGVQPACVAVTPGTMPSVTNARIFASPRSLKMRTTSPCAMPRACASVG